MNSYLFTSHRATLEWIWSNVSAPLMCVSRLFIVLHSLFWSPPAIKLHILLSLQKLASYFSLSTILDYSLKTWQALCGWEQGLWESKEWSKTLNLLRLLIIHFGFSSSSIIVFQYLKWKCLCEMYSFSEFNAGRIWSTNGVIDIHNHLTEYNESHFLWE